MSANRPESEKTSAVALVTGASGFAGRHLVRHLADSTNHEIIGIASRPRPPLSGGRLLVCDLRDTDLVTRVVGQYRPDVVFHLAGQAYVPQAFASPADTLIQNAVGQINLFEGCRNAGIEPVIVVAGSSDVYGPVPADELPIGESRPLDPANPYAVSKAAQDMYARQYHLSYGMSIVRARAFNHIGPGQSDRFVVSSLARQIVEVETGRADPVLLVGNLEARRDFLDVRDVVRAYAMIADTQFAGEAINIASGTPVSIRHILDRLIEISECDVDVQSDPRRMRPSDVPVIYGDSSKLRSSTGWNPIIPLDRSLADVLDDWREQLR